MVHLDASWQHGNVPGMSKHTRSQLGTNLKREEGREFGNPSQVRQDVEPVKVHSNVPRASIQARQVVVARDPRPSFEKMLEETQYTLAAQFRHYRQMAQSEIFNDKQASAFHKLVTSLASLQALEEKRVAMMRLASYSEAELAQLEPEARKLLEESKASKRD